MARLFTRARKMGEQLHELPVKVWKRITENEAAKHRDQQIISNWDQVRMIKKEIEILRSDEGYE